MLRGIRANAEALGPAMRAQEIVANNLANTQTVGFRQDRSAFHRELEDASAAGPNGATTGAAGATAAANALVLTPRIDLTPAAIETTGDPNHLAIDGAGFFAVQGEAGDLYTRDGGMLRGSDGTLLHRSGAPFLGDGGPIVAPSDRAIAVGNDGTVRAGDEVIGKLRVVRVTDPSSLHHVGQGLLRSQAGAEADLGSRVLQGSLEAGNSDPVTNLIEMMSLVRAFEANQRAILTQDQSLGRLLGWASQ